MKPLLLVLLVACGASSSPPATPAPAPAPAGSNAAIDCSSQNQAAVYCAHVKDPCCATEGWTCNNARYVEWFAHQCRR